MKTIIELTNEELLAGLETAVSPQVAAPTQAPAQAPAQATTQQGGITAWKS